MRKTPMNLVVLRREALGAFPGGFYVALLVYGGLVERKSAYFATRREAFEYMTKLYKEAR